MIPLIYHLYIIANWVIVCIYIYIYHLPPIKGTRKLPWENGCYKWGGNETKFQMPRPAKQKNNKTVPRFGVAGEKWVAHCPTQKKWVGNCSKRLNQGGWKKIMLGCWISQWIWWFVGTNLETLPWKLTNWRVSSRSSHRSPRRVTWKKGRETDSFSWCRSSWEWIYISSLCLMPPLPAPPLKYLMTNLKKLFRDKQILGHLAAHWNQKSG